MKKLLAILLVVCMLVTTFTACAKKDSNERNGGETDISSDNIQDGTDGDGTINGGDVSSDKDSDTSDEGDPDGEKSPIVDNGLRQVDFRNTDGTYISSVTVKKGECVPKPADPTNPEQDFLGWYVDTARSALFDFDAPIKENTTVYAAWKVNTVCNISSLAVDADARSISVLAYTNSACTVTVKFMEEDAYFNTTDGNYTYIDGSSLNITVSLVSGQEGEYVEYTASFDFELPEYFVSVAMIEGKPDAEDEILFVSIENTLKYKSFSEVKPESFDSSDTVLSMKDCGTGSFGVLADDVRVLSAENITEIVQDDFGTSVYEITSPSANISVGDKIFIADGKRENGALFMVKEITQNGDVYTVVPVTANEDNVQFLSSFYKFLKVGVEADESTSEIPLLRADKDGEAEANKGIPFDYDEDLFKNKYVTITGRIEGTVTPNLKIIYSPELFGEDYFYIQLVFDTDVHTTLTIDYKSEGDGYTDLTGYSNSFDFSLGKFRVPVGVYGFNIYISFGIEASYSISGSVVVGNVTESSIGFSFSSKDGVRAIREFSTESMLEKCEATATVRFGLAPSAGIGFIGDLVTASLDSFLGAEVRAVACGKWITPAVVENENTHLCDLCVDGSIYSIDEMYLNLDSKFKVKIKFDEDIEEITGVKEYVHKFEFGKKIPLIKKSKLIYTFYVSLVADEKFEKFGSGDCPNHGTTLIKVFTESKEGTRYPSEMKVFDADGKVVKTFTNPAVISGSMDDLIVDFMAKNPQYTYSDLGYLEKKTDENGDTAYYATLHLSPGQYTASVFYAKRLLAYVVEDIYIRQEDYVEKNEDFGSVSFTVDGEFNTFIGSTESESVDVYPENYSFRTKTYVLDVVYPHLVTHNYNNPNLPDDVYEIRPKAGKKYLITYTYAGDWVYFSGKITAVVDENGKLNLTFYFLEIPGDVLLEFDALPFEIEYKYNHYTYDEVLDGDGETIGYALVDLQQPTDVYEDWGYDPYLDDNNVVGTYGKIFESQLDAGRGNEYLGTDRVIEAYGKYKGD